MKTRTIQGYQISNAVVDLIYKASFSLPHAVEKRIDQMLKDEETDLARTTLKILRENNEIAGAEGLPLCQDCGVVIVFIEMGQSVLVEGSLSAAVNSGVEEAYRKFSLRKSIVADPLKRGNTGTNAPAFIHTDLVEGDGLSLTVYLKGGGSENMSALKMFRPTDRTEAIMDFIEETVVRAGPNPCPPLFLGVGIGGTADTAMLNAKKAVLREAGTRHPDPAYAELERRIEERLNGTGVGPLGFGGRSTAAWVYIKEAPTHIAMLPVALNLNCHSLRFGTVEL
ncbi:MAG TPA: fumarate hydratase [Spirochaetota bacterium]|nr:fumarate hydratase [Spirochaetota bacterium]